MAKRQSTANLEKSLEELEKLVIELETGELSLEDALKRYERAIHLTHRCQQALQDATQKVEILNGNHIEAFEPPTEKMDAAE
jgi:exodeoxyribonuclease VII small subunit